MSSPTRSNEKLYYHNGNILDPEIINNISKQILKKFNGNKVDIYFSDAGIDVDNKWNDQEKVTSQLHLGQCISGLVSLTKGGSFVAKTYCFNYE